MSKKEETRLEIFNNEEFGKLNVLIKDGEPFFIGREIVLNLGYDLSGKHVASEYIKQYCDEDDYILIDKNSPVEWGAVINYKELGQRGGYIVTESGLYGLVLGSEIQSAKRFKRWIKKEVLPSIRKHGAYMTDEVTKKAITDPDFIIQLATELKEERSKRELLEEENASLLPDAELARNVIKYSKMYTLKEVADLIELGRTELCTLLRIKKILSKQAGFNIPLNKYIKQGYFKIKLNENYGTSVTLVTSRGLKFIYRLIKKCDLLEEFDTETLLEVAKETSVA